MKDEVLVLVDKYRRDVAARRQLGDEHAEYHAQLPKVCAYKLLMDRGMTAKQAVEEFAKLLKEGVELGCGS